MFTTAEFSRKHSRTLCGPCATIPDRNCVMQVVFRFCKVHETSRALKVTCGVRQGQEGHGPYGQCLLQESHATGNPHLVGFRVDDRLLHSFNILETAP